MSTSEQKHQARPTAPQSERTAAGEYGEGGPHEATGVGPRNPKTPEQRLSDWHGPPDEYGNVARGRYGVHGYSGSPSRPQADASEARTARVATAGENAGSAAAEHDDQLRELIRQRLTEDPLLDASDVRVEVHHGRVTLAGTATSTRSRAEIEQTVENCGVLEVDNQLRPLS